ncbi:MAG TPA: FAD-dependent oxidoreductase, partial [Acidimicrobiales bacterium]|nr:FAD-dependent oxidoreductase [Acidimicrobiales bacterium]
MTRNNTISDVIVIGGGPAGSASAIDLAKNGLRVTLLDKSEFPRDKCCGDGLTAEALRILEEIGLVTDTISNWNTITDAVLFSPKGRRTQLP